MEDDLIRPMTPQEPQDASRFRSVLDRRCPTTVPLPQTALLVLFVLIVMLIAMLIAGMVLAGISILRRGAGVGDGVLPI